ncbi:hypothetical protein STP55_orf00180 [Salmonella phage STP55]|nr:hypothetical protein STP55_orf00180 [Salmonella phage STP55]
MVIIDSTDILIAVLSMVGVCILVMGIKKSLGKRVVEAVSSDLQPENTTKNVKDIKLILSSRVSKSLVPSIDDFNLEHKDPDTTPEEYFQYFMKGLGWPFIESCELKSKSNGFYAKIARKDEYQIVWFWNYNDTHNKQFLIYLHGLFKEYMNNGNVPIHKVETVESIVYRARTRNGAKPDYLSKYGFVWKEDI